MSLLTLLYQAQIHAQYVCPPLLHSTAIALRVKDGVVFAVQKLVTSKLHERGTNKRLFTVDQHVGVVRSRSTREQTPTCAHTTYTHTVSKSAVCLLVLVAGHSWPIGRRKDSGGQGEGGGRELPQCVLRGHPCQGEHAR